MLIPISFRNKTRIINPSHQRILQFSISKWLIQSSTLFINLIKHRLRNPILIIFIMKSIFSKKLRFIRINWSLINWLAPPCTSILFLFITFFQRYTLIHDTLHRIEFFREHRINIPRLEKFKRWNRRRQLI